MTPTAPPVTSALLLLGALLLLCSCQQSSQPPVIPVADPATTLQLDQHTSVAVPFGVFDLRVEEHEGGLTAGVQALSLPTTRAGQVIGDLFALEVAEYFQGSPCADCFGIRGMGRTSGGDLFVDLRMRHPFRTTDAREDLDVFDPRVIVVTPQLVTSYPGLGPVLGGIDGTQSSPVEVEGGLILNADGYTGRYDWLAEHPELVGTPRNYAGTINPYFDFFTDIDPDPEVQGIGIANRRMSMASPDDVQRVVISTDAMVVRGNKFEALLLIEVSYGQPAVRAIPTGQPGSRKNPVYFLPAFNRKEAVLLEAAPVPAWTQGAVGVVQSIQVAISDWQAGLVGVGPQNFALAPDYLNRTDVPHTSTLEAVHLSIPALDPVVKTVTSFPSGDGSLSLPWTTSLSVGNVNNPLPGTYYGVLAAVDTYHGALALPGFAYGGVQSFVRDFTTYQLVEVMVDPATPNDPPVASLKARRVGDPTWTPAPGPLVVNTGENVEFSLADSTDDLNAWATPAVHFDLDGNPGTGSNGGFETTLPAISNVATLSYSSAGSLNIRGKVQDSTLQFSLPVSLTLTVNPAPNNPPVAVYKARKQGDVAWTPAPGPLAISVGDTVEFTLVDSTDDLGLWSNPAGHYDLDGNGGNGFEVTGATIGTVVTRTYSAAGSTVTRAKVRDNLPQDSAEVTLTVTATGGTPTCYSVTPIADFPIRVYEHSADTLNGKIYIAGGWSPDWASANRRVNAMWEYDPATNSYTQLPGTFTGFQAGEGRSGLEVLALNNRIYCLGGEGTYVSTCSFHYNPTSWFDLGTNAFANGSNLNPSLWRAAGAVWNNRLWLPGGFREYNEFSCGSIANSVNTTTVYNPATNTWTNQNDFGNAIPAFTDRKWAHGVAVLNSKMYVLPGQYETAGGAQSYARTVAEYDLTATNPSWVAKDLAPAHRWLYEVEVVNNRAYIIGGLNDSAVAQSTIYQFDPTAAAGSQWTTLSTASCSGSPLPNPIYGYAAAVHNGEIYVFAGTQTLSNPIRASYKVTIF